MTEAGSAKEKYHQSPPKLPAAPIEKDHNEELNSIQVNKDLKEDIKSITKKAEQALVGALVKFHHRHVERLKIKYRKLKQATCKSCISFHETNQPIFPQNSS